MGNWRFTGHREKTLAQWLWVRRADQPARGLIGLMVGISLVLATLSHFVLIDANQFVGVLPASLTALILGLAHRLTSSRTTLNWRLVRVGIVVALFALLIGLFARGYSIERMLTPYTVAHLSLPFAVFIAIAGQTRFELAFLVAVCLMTYVAGTWASPQGAGFVGCVMAGGAALVMLLVLGLLYYDVGEFQRRKAERIAIGASTAWIRGRFPSSRTLAWVALMAAMTLVVSFVLFAILPRPPKHLPWPGNTNTPARDPDPSGGNAGTGRAGNPNRANAEGPVSFLPGNRPSNSNAGVGGHAPESTSTSGIADAVELQRVGDILQSTAEVFTVRVSQDGRRIKPNHPIYLRAVAFDEFTIHGWRRSSTAAADWQVWRERAPYLDLPFFREIYGPNPMPFWRNYRIDNPTASVLNFDLLPRGNNADPHVLLPDAAVRVHLAELRRNATLGEYETQERRMMPHRVSAAAIPLRQLLPTLVNRASTDPGNGKNTQLPPNRSPRFKHLASQIEDAGLELIDRTVVTDFDRVEAVLAFLHKPSTLRRAPFRYSLRRNPPAPNVTILEDFLFHQPVGHCELFASAAAVLLREMGVACRLAGGYAGGEWKPIAQEFLFQALHAHVWIEVHFREVGWFPLEPTLAGERDRVIDSLWTSDPTPEPTAASSNRHSRGSGGTGGWPEMPRDLAEKIERDRLALQPTRPTPVQADNNAIAAFAQEEQAAIWSAMTTWVAGLWSDKGTLLAYGGLGLVAAAALWGLLRLVRPWWRRFTILSPRSATATQDPHLIAARTWYDQLLGKLAKIGVRRDNSQTPAEFADFVQAKFGEAESVQIGDLFRHLTTWFYALRFGSETLTEERRVTLKQMCQNFLAQVRHIEQQQARRKAETRGTPSHSSDSTPSHSTTILLPTALEKKG